MAEERLYSNSWYRVEDLRPKLRNHTEFHRHHYRGQLTYVLQDHANERYHRFSPMSYELIGLMDGVRTSDEIWQLASERMQDEAPTQDQFIQLLGQLHSADILLTDVPPDTAEVLQRYDKQRRKKWMQQLMSPLFWRFPVYDPEKLLNRLKPLVEPFYSRLALIIWSFVVATGLVLAVVNWGSLSENVVDRVLSTQNIFLLWFIFPVFKGLHEFGHAFTVKRYGGEVHVMGIMLLVLTPLPFVDASAASAFRSKRQRILVSSAGMMVEIFLASLALMLWLNIEPGLIRTILFNVIFIAGVSTILFNINPLLRFDGYYILADLIEIVNLRSRSTRYLSHVLEKNLLGNKEAVPMPATPGERRWFIFYSIASFIYRIFILTAIIMFIASKFFFVGAALAIWAVIAWGILPIYKVVKYIVSSPRLYKVRARAVGASGGVLLAVLLLMFVIPLPMHTRADGVIWVPEQAIIRAGADGFIVEILAPPGSSVRKGDPLLRIHDEMAELDLKVHAEELAETRARYDEIWLQDRVRAEVLKKEIAHREDKLRRTSQKITQNIVRSDSDGIFIIPQPQDLPGRFIRKGTPLAHVLNLETLTARVVVPQDQIDLVRESTYGVEVRLAENIASTLPADIQREVPAATDELPSSALGSAGGGNIATDPYDQRGVRAMERVFQFDLDLPAKSGVVNVGGHVYARFYHGWEPIAFRWYRDLRLLFLSKFNV
ncbi:MAG: hypothetical protein VCD34_07430 [Planctomycetota bacterium]